MGELQGISRRQVLVVFSGLVPTLLLAALDATIVATALPTIVGELWPPERREELARVLGQLARELVPDARPVPAGVSE